MMSSSAVSPAPAAPVSASPLEDLYACLSAPMEATNTLILDRLQSPVETIPQVAAYLIASGGKRIRPLMTLACAAAFDVTNDHPAHLAAAVEFIHSATLLHDDVVDQSPERRGKPAANLVYGNKPAVLVGDFLFARSFELMVETGSIDVLALLSRASAIIAEGEVLQLQTANNLATTLDEYLQVIESKTAALFAAACAVGPALADAPQAARDALYEYGRHVGIAFQIADDVLDYAGADGGFGKQAGNDFLEGKMTAPVIFALRDASSESRAFWSRCLADRAVAEGDFDRAVGLLNASGALRASMDLAARHADLAVSALNRALPEGGALFEILARVPDFAARRTR